MYTKSECERWKMCPSLKIPSSNDLGVAIPITDICPRYLDLFLTKLAQTVVVRPFGNQL